MSLSRDEDIDVSSDYGSQSDYVNYTVLMPPTPDNQPMDGAAAATSASHHRSGSSSRIGLNRRGADDEGHDGVPGGAKMDRRMSVMRNDNKSMLLRSQTGDFDHNRWLFESKGTYGIGNAFWPKEEDAYGPDGIDVSMEDFIDKPWKPLTRKVKIPPGILSPYRSASEYLVHNSNFLLHSATLQNFSLP